MEPIPWRIWRLRLVYIALVFMILAYRLLPLGPAGGALVAPDLILALTFAWLLRQPQAVPIGILVAVFLLSDFLLGRPPGLWTALVLLIGEALRRRRDALTEFNFLVEWLWVIAAIFAVIVGERVALWLLFAPQTSLGLALVHGLTTVAVYPVVVAISQYLFGVRKLSPTDAENL